MGSTGREDRPTCSASVQRERVQCSRARCTIRLLQAADSLRKEERARTKTCRRSPGPGATVPAVYTKCPACTTPSIFTVSVTDEDDRNEHATVRTLRPYTYTAQHLAYTVRPILYSHGRLFDVVPRLSTWCLALAPTARSAPCARCLLHAQRPSGHTTAISGHAWSIAPQGPPSPACPHLTRGRRGRRVHLAPGRRSASGSRVRARRSR